VLLDELTSLDAGETFGDRMLTVPAHGNNAVVLDIDLNAAVGIAETAKCLVRAHRQITSEIDVGALQSLALPQ